MPVTDEKRAEQAAFDAKVDVLRRKRLTQRHIAQKLKCSATKVKAAIKRLGEQHALEHLPVENSVVAGGIVHHCSCGWRSRPWFSGMLATAAGMQHREEMDRIQRRNRGTGIHANG